MSKNIGIIIGIVAIAGIGFFAFSSENAEKSETAERNTVEEQMVGNDGATAEKEAVPEDSALKTDNAPKEDEGVMVENEGVITKAGSYEAYSENKIAMAEAGDVVLFFHATWCPSCRALDSDIEKNMSAIPEGLAILKADYDKETELRKQYGVTTQHTLVQVDKDGNLIKKWSGGSKLENVLSQID